MFAWRTHDVNAVVDGSVGLIGSTSVDRGVRFQSVLDFLGSQVKVMVREEFVK